MPGHWPGFWGSTQAYLWQDPGKHNSGCFQVGSLLSEKKCCHSFYSDLIHNSNEKILLHTFQTFCPVGVQISQTVIHFASFQVQARKRGVLGWALGCSVYVHTPKRCVWLLSREQGLGVVFSGWAKWNPTWAKWDPYGQFVWKVGKSALELGGRGGDSIIRVKRILMLCNFGHWMQIFFSWEMEFQWMSLDLVTDQSHTPCFAQSFNHS